MQEELGGWEAFLGIEESDENYGIFVLIEKFDEPDFKNSLKLITPAMTLKNELGHPVNLAMVGDVTDEDVERLKSYAVSQIHVKKLKSVDEMLDFLKNFVSEVKPFVLIGSSDGFASQVFPYLAQTDDVGYLGGGIQLNLSSEDNKVLVKRKIYGGLLIETVKNLKQGVQFVTLRPDSFEEIKGEVSTDVEVKIW